MAGNPYTWSTTAATNSSADPDINWAEGQLPGTVNDSARGMMAGVAGWLKDTNSTLTTGGSANAHTVTSNVAYAALASGMRLHLKAGFTNTGAATLNLTPSGGGAFGAKAIKVIIDSGETDPVANNIRANGHYVVEYDTAANAAAGAWILLNPSAAPAAVVFLSAQTASNSATIDFSTAIDSTYDEYLLTGTNVHPATDATDLWIRLSEDAGSTFKAGAADYKWGTNTVTDGAVSAAAGSTGDTKIVVSASNSNNAARPMSFEVRLYAPSNTTAAKQLIINVVSYNSGGSLVRLMGCGMYFGTNNAVNAVRVLSSSGNITSGAFHLYGIRKS